MRDLYLHIGLHKTGTTYLQHVVLENRDLFLQAGLGLAPYLHPIEGNHYPLLQEVKAGRSLNAIFDEVAQARGETVLISAEELCNHVMEHRDRAVAFRNAAARHFRVRIVVCLRRQDYLKESTFAQAVKTWYTGDITRDTHYLMDHDARLRLIEEVFGLENVKVMLYRDERTPATGPQDLLGDFLRAVEIDIDRTRIKPMTPRNVTMHRRKILFLSKLPKPRRARSDRKHMAMARFVARVLDASTAVADDHGGRFMMSPQERHALVAAYQDSNRALVARYGLEDADHFTALPDPEAPWTPPVPISAQERRQVFREVLRASWARRNPVAALSQSAGIGVAFARMVRRAPSVSSA